MTSSSILYLGGSWRLYISQALAPQFIKVGEHILHDVSPLARTWQSLSSLWQGRRVRTLQGTSAKVSKMTYQAGSS